MSYNHHNFYENFVHRLGEGNERLTGTLHAILNRTIDTSRYAGRRDGGSFFNAERAAHEPDDLNYLRNWLKAAMTAGEPWIFDTDRAGLPKRLARVTTFREVTEAANEDIVRKRESLRAEFGRRAMPGMDAMIDQGDIRIEQRFASGLTLVRLLTPHALDLESMHMRSCIGYGWYDDNLGWRGYEYFSLRDRSNLPHVTMEVVDGTVLQSKGKENAPPSAKYMPDVKQTIREHGWRLSPRVSQTGLLAQGNLMAEALNLGDFFEWPGDVDLSWFGALARLPRDTMKVGGDLRVSFAKAAHLPRHLEVGGDLIVDQCLRLETGPEILNVAGRVEITDCPSLKRIAHEGRIGRGLVLQNTGICYFGDVAVHGPILHDQSTYRDSEDFRDALDLGARHNRLLFHPGFAVA